MTARQVKWRRWNQTIEQRKVAIIKRKTCHLHSCRPVGMMGKSIALLAIISMSLIAASAGQDHSAINGQVSRKSQPDSNNQTNSPSENDTTTSTTTAELKFEPLVHADKLKLPLAANKSQEGEKLTGRSPQPPKNFLLNYKPTTVSSNPLSSFTRQIRQTTRRRLTSPAPETTTSASTSLRSSSGLEDLDELGTEAPISLRDREKKRKIATSTVASGSRNKGKKKPTVEPTLDESLDEFVDEELDDEDEDYKSPKRRKSKTTAKPEAEASTATDQATSTMKTTTPIIKNPSPKNQTGDNNFTTSSPDNSTSEHSSPNKTMTTLYPINIESFMHAIGNGTNGLPLVYPANCCCNHSQINATGLVPEVSKTNNKTTLTQSNLTDHHSLSDNSSLASSTTPNSLVPAFPVAHNGSTSLVGGDQAMRQARNNTSPQQVGLGNKYESNNGSNKSIAEMMKDINEDHSKLHSNVQQQASSLRRFIVLSSICVVIATSIAVAIIVFFLK